MLFAWFPLPVLSFPLLCLQQNNVFWWTLYFSLLLLSADCHSHISTSIPQQSPPTSKRDLADPHLCSTGAGQVPLEHEALGEGQPGSSSARPEPRAAPRAKQLGGLWGKLKGRRTPPS